MGLFHMRLFNKILTIFWPTIIESISFLLLGIISNEIYIFDSTVDSQSDDILYGIALSDRTAEYKLYNLINRNPELAIIGTSRVMQFRAEMFPDYNTYNAGVIVSKISHILPLLEKLINENKTPQIVIIGLDQNFFNESWDTVRPNDSLLYNERLLSSSNFVIPDRLRLLLQIVKEPGVFINNSILKPENIGLQGKVYNQGFRVDGSYYYGRYYEFGIENDLDFIDTTYRIENGVSSFEYADEYNSKALNELEKFLDLAAQNEILVIGFMQPYAPSINDLMESIGRYEYINKVSIEIERPFRLYGYN
jgi:hypothetical protein